MIIELIIIIPLDVFKFKFPPLMPFSFPGFLFYHLPGGLSTTIVVQCACVMPLDITKCRLLSAHAFTMSSRVLYFCRIVSLTR